MRVIILKENVLLLALIDAKSLLLEGFPAVSSCLSSGATTTARAITLAPVRATISLSRCLGTNNRQKQTYIDDGNH